MNTSFYGKFLSVGSRLCLICVSVLSTNSTRRSLLQGDKSVPITNTQYNRNSNKDYTEHQKHKKKQKKNKLTNV